MLLEVWLNSAGYGDAEYLVNQHDRCTYAQAHARVASVANWLVANGIGQHDRVAIAMRNYPEWMLAYWAVVCIIGAGGNKCLVGSRRTQLRPQGLRQQAADL